MRKAVSSVMDLRAYFGDYASCDEAWESTKAKLEIGHEISGIVVLQYEFGVFLDIGFGFPGFIDITRLGWDDNQPLTYPAEGSDAKGRVYFFDDRLKQIRITRRRHDETLDG
jgi:ribosomal protein S1